MWWGFGLGLAGEDESDVVGLLFGADPGIEREHDLSRDHVQGLIAVAADDLHHALFAELAEIVLRLRDAVRVSDEDVSRLHVEAVFVVVHAVHQTYDGPTLIEHLETAPVDATRLQSKALRMPVQWVNRPDPDFRGFSGQIASGVVRPGL